jgi:hypothetical protein
LWSVRGLATIDATRAARGTHSLHLVSTAAKPAPRIRETATFPALASDLWGRLFFYLAAHSTLRSDRLVEGSENAGKANWILTGIGFAKNGALDAQYFNSTGGDAGADYAEWDDFVLPVGRWICVEWHFSRTLNEQRAWIDGVERPKLHLPANSALRYAVPTYDSLAFGLGDGIFESWIDEIAVGGSRIGCDR